MTSWEAVLVAVAVTLPGWCGLTGFRTARSSTWTDRPASDAAASLVLSLLWIGVLRVCGMDPQIRREHRWMRRPGSVRC